MSFNSSFSSLSPLQFHRNFRIVGFCKEIRWDSDRTCTESVDQLGVAILNLSFLMHEHEEFFHLELFFLAAPAERSDTAGSLNHCATGHSLFFFVPLLKFLSRMHCNFQLKTEIEEFPSWRSG